MTRDGLAIERYGRTRFWGVYEAGELLCVTVYKKGAQAVKNRIERGAPVPCPLSAAASEPLPARRARRRF